MNQFEIIRFYINSIAEWMKYGIKITKMDLATMSRSISISDLIACIKVFVKDSTDRTLLLEQIRNAK